MIIFLMELQKKPLNLPIPKLAFFFKLKFQLILVEKLLPLHSLIFYNFILFKFILVALASNKIHIRHKRNHRREVR